MQVIELAWHLITHAWLPMLLLPCVRTLMLANSCLIFSFSSRFASSHWMRPLREPVSTRRIAAPHKHRCCQLLVCGDLLQADPMHSFLAICGA